MLHVDRAGHPSVSSFFNTDDTKEEYNASEPANDRKRWLDQFVHLMGHTGNYTREEAIAEIDKERTLPDVLSFGAAVDPMQAYFSQQLGEFILPYDAVRTAREPEAVLMEFLQSTYVAAADLARWDRAALECPLGVAGRPRPT